MAKMCYILQLSLLKELFLYGNKIAQLPSEVGLMTNLETLAMSENNITDLPGLCKIGFFLHDDGLYIVYYVRTSNEVMCWKKMSVGES